MLRKFEKGGSLMGEGSSSAWFSYGKSHVRVLTLLQYPYPFLHLPPPLNPFEPSIHHPRTNTLKPHVQSSQSPTQQHLRTHHKPPLASPPLTTLPPFHPCTLLPQNVINIGFGTARASSSLCRSLKTQSLFFLVDMCVCMCVCVYIQDGGLKIKPNHGNCWLWKKGNRGGEVGRGWGICLLKGGGMIAV